MSKAVAKRKDTGLAEVISIFEAHEGAGFEDTSPDDFVLPFIKKVENMSKCMIASHQNYVPDAKAGQFVHTVLKKSFDSVYMIPVKYDNMYQHYRFPEGTGGWIANYLHNSSAVPKFGQVEREGKKFRVPVDQTDTYLQQAFNYIGIFLDQDKNLLGPAILPMEKSQCKVARQFNVMLNTKKIARADGSSIKAPIFSHMYHLSLQSISNDMGAWYSFNYDSGELLTDPNLLTEAVDLAATLRDVDTTTLAPEEDASEQTPKEETFEV